MIHFITPEYPPRHGGVADYTHQIATELSRRGERVHVWGPAGSASEPGSAVVVHPVLGDFRGGDLRRANDLLDGFPSPRRLVVQWVPHGYGRRAMNVPFCFWLWRRSVAGDVIDLIVHEPFVTFSRSVGQYVIAAVQRAMTLMLMSAARRVLVTTRAWTPLLEPYRSHHAQAIEWLPVPSSLQAIDASAASELRRRYAPGGERLVGHFGTHGPMVTTLLAEAIPLIADTHAAARFVMIGAGSDTFRSALVAQHPELARRVSATGALPSSELPAHIAACDVMLQPYPDGVTSRRTTVMAALFARVPVVTTRGKLTEPFWQDEQPVRLADVDDVPALVGHLVQLLGDPAERQRQAATGYAFYDRWFDVRHTVAALTA